MFKLRYMQTEARDRVYEEWDRVQSTAVIAATGVGKTEIYLAIATDTILGRVLIVVHRDYLIDQPVRRLKSHGFEDVAIEKAEHRSEGGMFKAKVVFASVQSLAKPERLAAFDPNGFDAVIIDEGHRAVAASYRRVIDHFKQNTKLRFLILTATPKRKDGIALGTVCDSVAYSYPPQVAIEEGWIVPLRFYRREVAGLDFSTVKLKGADLDPEQAQALMMEERPLHDVCASLAEDRGPTVIFCPGVDVAKAYSALMNHRYRPNRATVLWMDSTPEEREDAGKRLAHGDLDYLFNCDLLTEGYDVPELVRVVWAAPTASLVKFTQGTGRGFRTHGSLRTALSGGREQSDERRLLIAQSPKPFCQVVTYYPQNCQHQLCEPTDILGGDELPDDTRRFVKQIQEITATQEGGSAPEEDVQTAQDVTEIVKLLEQRRKGIKAAAEVKDTEYDAFGHSKIRSYSGSTGNERSAAKVVSSDWPATEKKPSNAMKGWFKYKGVAPDAVESLTAWRAYTVRQLVEHGVAMDTALSYGKNQALTVLAKYEKKNGQQSEAS